MNAIPIAKPSIKLCKSELKRFKKPVDYFYYILANLTSLPFAFSSSLFYVIFEFYVITLYYSCQWVWATPKRFIKRYKKIKKNIEAIKVKETFWSFKYLEAYASGNMCSIVYPSKAPQENAKRIWIIMV